MGTWATGPFDNDFAQDWAQDLYESDDLYFIAGTLDNVLSADPAGDLEAPFGAEGLAAVETLLRLEGRAGAAADTTPVDDWVERVRPTYRRRADLLDKAARVLERVLGERSELRELWHDSAHYNAWRATVEAQQARLQG